MSEVDAASNPYLQPASAVVEQADDPRRMVPAGKWRRFFNWLIDKLAILGLAIACATVAMLLGGEAMLARIEHISWWQDQLMTAVLLVLYYTLMEGMFGVTLGKLVTGTRVVDAHGLPPGMRTAFLRSLARLIPFDALSLLFGEDEDPRAWHDRLPKTRVVMRKLTPPRRSPSLGAP